MSNYMEWVEKLGMEQHSEGGYFKEILKSEEMIDVDYDATRKRHLYTSIYFLLTDTNPSHFHRLKADEVWFFHTGTPLTVHLLHPDGRYETIRLGLNIEKGERLQAVVPKGVIFGSSVEEVDGFSLVSCVVSPGFDFVDFELFTKKELLSIYPNESDIIERLAYNELPSKAH